MIGDAFGKLFDWLWSALLAIFGFFGDLFGKLFSVIWEAIVWLSKFIRDLFRELLQLLVNFFGVIFELICCLLYLIYMIGVLAIKFFYVIFEAAKVFFSLIVGLGRTLASLKYSQQSTGGHGYSEMIGKIMSNLNYLQMDVVAYILLFCLWFVTAISAIKLIASIRVGGD